MSDILKSRNRVSERVGKGGKAVTFDQLEYLRLIESRGDFIREKLAQLLGVQKLTTGLDAGAGIGFFVPILEEAGLQTQAFEGRLENVEEARKRFPNIQIQVGDIESPDIVGLGIFDFVLCFGLLYHLENPLLAIRHLRRLTGKTLLLESMCVPESEPWAVLREEPRKADQSLTDVAFYASEGCLAKMLYRAGFSRVYQFDQLPDHSDFRETAYSRRRRTVLLASNQQISLTGITEYPEPFSRDPWKKRTLPTRWMSDNIRKFKAKSPRGRYAALARMWMRKFPSVPVPYRLWFGAWWLASPGDIDSMVLEGTFEAAELRFVERFLQPGMTVVDVGGHHGLYTLLASSKVGLSGRVITFEPSPNEREILKRHVRINRLANVKIESWAVGGERGTGKLFVVEGAEDGCHSLRPPNTESRNHTSEVEVIALDDYLLEKQMARVDFLKLDIEGAELEALTGAKKLLTDANRPVVLAEVYDIRTEPWGYRSKEIVRYLEQIGYRWHQILDDGQLGQLDTSADTFDANLVALPVERLGETGLAALVKSALSCNRRIESKAE